MQTVESIHSVLRALVPEGIPETLKQLKKYLSEKSPLFDIALSLEARLNEANRQRIRDVISDENLRLEYNRIRQDLLVVINQLTERDLAGHTAQSSKPIQQEGRILYRIPHNMALGKSTKCVIRLANEEDSILRNIELDSHVSIKPVRTSDLMQVSLLDPSGDGCFEIRSLSEAEQIIFKNDYTEWIFYVKPMKSGTFPLMLKVAVIELIHGKERKHELVFEEIIQITSETVAEEAEVFRASSVSFSQQGHALAPKNAGKSFVLAAKWAALPAQAKAIAAVFLIAVSSVAAWPLLKKWMNDEKEKGSVVETPPGVPVNEKPDAEFSPIGPIRTDSISSEKGDDNAQQELLAWNRAKEINTLEGYKIYLETHPNGLHEKEAQAAIDILTLRGGEEDSIRRQPPKTNVLPHKPPNHRPSGYDIEEAQKKLDLSAFDMAADKDDPSSYGRYLSKHANGNYAWKVKKRLKDLEAAATPTAPFPKRPAEEMVKIMGGAVVLGCRNACPEHEQPAHTVEESTYFIDKYEVTNQQYAAFLNDYGKTKVKAGKYKGKLLISIKEGGLEKSGNNWRSRKGYEKHPVVNVTWFGANEYARFYGLRLPTEAEWEFAALGGAKGNGFDFSGSDNAGDAAWYVKNSGNKTHPVGQKKANGLGLFDMSGNVKEWCHDDARSYKSGSFKNPTGNPGDRNAVMRGGSFRSPEDECRVGRRAWASSAIRYIDYGFRCVRVPD